MSCFVFSVVKSMNLVLKEDKKHETTVTHFQGNHLLHHHFYSFPFSLLDHWALLFTQMTEVKERFLMGIKTSTYRVLPMGYIVCMDLY